MLRVLGIVISVGLLASAVQAWQALVNGSATASVDVANAVAVDPAGDIFATGFVGTDPNNIRHFIVVKAAGRSGRELWRREIRGTGESMFDAGRAIAIDQNGDVVAVGDTENQGTLRDLTVVKLSGNSGRELWRTVINGRADWFDEGRAVAIDANGDVLVAGRTADRIFDLDFTVAKLAGDDGTEIWRAVIASDEESDDTAFAVAVGPTGDVVAAGDTRGFDFSVVKLRGATGVEQWRMIIPSDGARGGIARAVAFDAAGDVVAAGGAAGGFTVIKVAGTSGTALWQQTLNDGGDAEAFDLALDAAGDIIASGSIVASDGTETKVVKFSNLTGAELWRSAAGSVSVSAVALDDGGDVLIAGTRVVLRPNKVRQFAVVKLSGSTGALSWQRVLSGTAYNGAGDSIGSASAVAVDRFGDIAAAGSTRNACAYSDLTIVKLGQETGEERWRLVVNGTANLSIDRAQRLALSPSGDVVAVGDTQNAGTCRDFTVSKFAAANGSVLWRTAISGSFAGSTDLGRDVAVDANGNVLAAGQTENADSSQDFTVAKFDGENGTELWRAVIDGGAGGTDSAQGLVVDPGGNVVAAGFLEGGGTGRDFLVVKLDGTNGEELWRIVLDGTASGVDVATAVAADTAGNIVAAGAVENRLSGFDILVIKLAGGSGAELWRQEINGTFEGSIDEAFSVEVDAAGDVVVAGFSDGLSLGEAAVAPNFTVIKLSGASGAEVWRSVIDGSRMQSTDFAVALTIDTNGDVVAAGSTENEGTRQDFTVVKLARESGAEIWRRLIGGPDGSSERAHAVAVDRHDDVVATGLTVGHNGPDLTVIKFSGGDGGTVWRRDVNGTRSDGLDPADSGNWVELDSDGNVIVVGSTENAASGDDFTVVKLRGIDGRDFAGTTCTGDCDNDGVVEIHELVTGVSIALGGTSLDACVPFDPSGNALVSVDEIITAVRNRLHGLCAAVAHGFDRLAAAAPQ